MILYPVFYKKSIARKKQHIFNPTFASLGEIELPRSALLHYIPQDLTEYGIAPDDILINQYPDDIYVNHVQDLETPLGNPRVKTVALNAIIRAYHNRNRRLKLVRNYSSVLRNDRWLFVNNYAMAQHKIIYRPVLFVGYYRWYNMMFNVLKEATKFQSTSNRYQFIHLTLPAVIPQINQLNIYEARMNKGLTNVGLEELNDYDDQDQLEIVADTLNDVARYEDWTAPISKEDEIAIYNMVRGVIGDRPIKGTGLESTESKTYGEVLSSGLEALRAFESEVMSFRPELNMSIMKRIRTPADYWFIHFWTWLGEMRQGSLFSMLDHSKLDRINLVISNMGADIILNLGVLETWRQSVISESDGDVAKVMNFRKHLLRMFTKLFNVKTGGTEVITDDTAAVTTSEPVISESTSERLDAEEQQADEQDSTIDTEELYGISIPGIGDIKLEPEPLPEQKAETKKEVDAKGGGPKPAEVIEEEVYESKSFTDDISDDEFNVDLEQRHHKEPVIEYDEPKPEDGINKYISILTDANMLSAAEYQRYVKLSEKYKTIPATTGEGTIADEMIVKPEAIANIGGLEAPDSISIIDKGLLKSSTKDFDKQYVENVMSSDIAGAIMSIQNAGICVIDIKSEEVYDAKNHYVVYSVTVQPVGGKQTTIRFRFPKVDDDGVMVINGTKTRLRKQRVDIPIRKVNTSTVSMTSYYSKLFMVRSPKSIHDYGKWLCNRITALSLPVLDGNGSVVTPAEITGLVLGRPFEPAVRVPHTFAILASRFKRFTYDEYQFNFVLKETTANLDPKVVDKFSSSGLTVTGNDDKGNPLLMDDNGVLYIARQDVLDSIGDIETLLGLETSKAPVETAELGIFRKKVPVGFILAYYYGFTEMLRRIGAEVRIVQRGDRLNLQPNERTIVFNDEVVIFSRHDRLTSLLLNGFNNYEKDIATFSRYDFDRTSVYLNVLSSNKMGVRWIRELELMREMWIDPITSGLLKDMGAPIHFDLLLLYAAKMLLNDQHIRETSFRGQRIRGYERISGAIYLELVKAVRQQKSRATSTKTGLDLNPDAVWFALLRDTSSIPVEECNPIHNIKDSEVITYAGTGGRTSRSVTKPGREYLKDNMGVLSEHTVDNADVAYTGYLSMDPLITNLRGMTAAATEDTPATNIVSTSALLNPAADRDDAKRTNFIGVQHSQAMYAVGYQTTPYRTGEERMIAHRASKLFAYAAEADGVITEMSSKHLMAEYETHKVGVELGSRFGSASGTVYHHEIITDLEVGHKFKKGDILCWNRNYFERDFMEPTQVSWKAGVMTHLILREDQFSFEDSGIITRHVAKKLATETVKVVAISVNFDQEVRNLVPVGTNVEQDDILCIIEDRVSANLAGVDEGSYDSLRLMAAPGHKSKVTGKIAKIDVTYRGDIDDMSESLAILTNRCDRERAKINKRLNKKGANTGAVREDLRVGGKPLETNQAIIEIYIVVPMPTLKGDKGVMTNQMKFTFGRIVEDDLITESGLQLGGEFSNKGIANRMVTSPYICGVTNHLLFTITKNAQALYKELKNG
ncbi:hypothetical protein [Proteus columbae]|uniref:hypothetical protein n=1 Tax=Proteus columbae TaxID=1987580 RepID=UPI00288A802E|nr:hypothetical protein [Proteus columbae]